MLWGCSGVVQFVFLSSAGGTTLPVSHISLHITMRHSNGLVLNHELKFSSMLLERGGSKGEHGMTGKQ